MKLLATTGPKPMYTIEDGSSHTALTYSVPDVLQLHYRGLRISSRYEDYLKLITIAEADTIEGIIDQIPELLI